MSIRDVFHFMDVDKSGTMEFDEFSEFVKSLPITMKEAELKELYQSMDANGDGTMDVDEFNTLCTKLEEMLNMSRHVMIDAFLMEQMLRRLTGAFGENRDAYLPYDDVMQMLQALATEWNADLVPVAADVDRECRRDPDLKEQGFRSNEFFPFLWDLWKQKEGPLDLLATAVETVDKERSEKRMEKTIQDEEAQKAYAEKQERCPQEVEDAFELFDSDGSGLIGVNEAVAFVECLESSLTTRQISTIFRRSDNNDNGFIDKEEFFGFLQELTKELEIPINVLLYQFNRSQYRKVFELADTDDSKTLSCMELYVLLSVMCKALGTTKYSQEEIFDLVRKADIDDSGDLDFEEFCPLIEDVTRGVGICKVIAQLENTRGLLDAASEGTSTESEAYRATLAKREEREKKFNRRDTWCQCKKSLLDYRKQLSEYRERAILAEQPVADIAPSALAYGLYLIRNTAKLDKKWDKNAIGKVFLRQFGYSDADAASMVKDATFPTIHEAKHHATTERDLCQHWLLNVVAWISYNRCRAIALEGCQMLDEQDITLEYMANVAEKTDDESAANFVKRVRRDAIIQLEPLLAAYHGLIDVWSDDDIINSHVSYFIRTTKDLAIFGNQENFLEQGEYENGEKYLLRLVYGAKEAHGDIIAQYDAYCRTVMFEDDLAGYLGRRTNILPEFRSTFVRPVDSISPIQDELKRLAPLAVQHRDTGLLLLLDRWSASIGEDIQRIFSWKAADCLLRTAPHLDAESAVDILMDFADGAVPDYVKREREYELAEADFRVLVEPFVTARETSVGTNWKAVKRTSAGLEIDTMEGIWRETLRRAEYVKSHQQMCEAAVAQLWAMLHEISTSESSSVPLIHAEILASMVCGVLYGAVDKNVVSSSEVETYMQAISTDAPREVQLRDDGICGILSVVDFTVKRFRALTAAKVEALSAEELKAQQLAEEHKRRYEEEIRQEAARKEEERLHMEQIAKAREQERIEGFRNSVRGRIASSTTPSKAPSTAPSGPPSSSSSEGPGSDDDEGSAPKAKASRTPKQQSASSTPAPSRPIGRSPKDAPLRSAPQVTIDDRPPSESPPTSSAVSTKEAMYGGAEDIVEDEEYEEYIEEVEESDEDDPVVTSDFGHDVTGHAPFFRSLRRAENIIPRPGRFFLPDVDNDTGLLRKRRCREEMKRAFLRAVAQACQADGTPREWYVKKVTGFFADTEAKHFTVGFQDVTLDTPTNEVVSAGQLALNNLMELFDKWVIESERHVESNPPSEQHDSASNSQTTGPTSSGATTTSSDTTTSRSTSVTARESSCTRDPNSSEPSAVPPSTTDGGPVSSETTSPSPDDSSDSHLGADDEVLTTEGTEPDPRRESESATGVSTAAAFIPALPMFCEEEIGAEWEVAVPHVTVDLFMKSSGESEMQYIKRLNAGLRSRMAAWIVMRMFEHGKEFLQSVPPAMKYLAEFKDYYTVTSHVVRSYPPTEIVRYVASVLAKGCTRFFPWYHRELAAGTEDAVCQPEKVISSWSDSEVEAAHKLLQSWPRNNEVNTAGSSVKELGTSHRQWLELCKVTFEKTAGMPVVEAKEPRQYYGDPTSTSGLAQLVASIQQFPDKPSKIDKEKFEYILRLEEIERRIREAEAAEESTRGGILAEEQALRDEIDPSILQVAAVGHKKKVVTKRVVRRRLKGVASDTYSVASK